ncbi:MAG: N-acetylmuramoyl-L-alanine amidase [Planctomycetota bacterium]
MSQPRLRSPDRPLRDRPGPVCFEPIEPRILFSGDLVPVGTQPEGSLSEKIVYVHAGHGWEFTGSSWVTQRPETFEMVEDFGNIDQMNFLIDYLWNAGATVVPLRPAGHQLNEVVLDNDDAEVTFVGNWSNSSSPIYFGTAGDTPYRFASTNATETAYARYRPDIPEAGHYPVYAWTRAGSDRVEQLYRVHHAGGITEVTINHRRVGNGWVYLGEYYLEAGTDAYVDISNRSDDPSGSVVIADAIRFGNGIGDSTYPREDESSLYWVQEQLGVGASGSVGGVVSSSIRHAARMNRSADGSLSDRVFVSFHSNAGGGRGALGLHNTANGGATPNQFDLARTLAKQVNDDLVALNGAFEHNWFDRGDNLTFQASFNYGEINNLYAANEFDATILETAFHDNQFDAELMRDPKVRDAIARATYQGIIEYFNDVDGGATPILNLPPPVTDLRTSEVFTGVAQLNWSLPASDDQVGDAPTGYMVYQSTDGVSFDGGTYVDGALNTQFFVTDLGPAEGPRYFRVAAVNAAGQSLSPDTVAFLPDAADQRVLIVNGFDRLDRTLNPTQGFPNPASANTIERVRPQLSNSFDYAVQHAEAIAAYGNGQISINTVQNEAVASGAVDLLDYDAVFWISGEESSADATFSLTEQSAVGGYLAGGGNFFVSGAEIAWDLDFLNNGRFFYNSQFRADYVADDAGTYNAAGVAGSIFEGLSLDFDTRDTVYDAQFPDVIAPLNGATAALTYVGGSGGTAAVQYDGSGVGLGNVVNLGFPFETIDQASQRNAVMAATLEFFGLSNVLTPEFIVGDYNGDQIVSQGDLNLVLLNWGSSDLPEGWVAAAQFADGQISQNELNSVLLNWGNTAPVAASAAALAASDDAVTPAATTSTSPVAAVETPEEATVAASTPASQVIVATAPAEESGPPPSEPMSARAAWLYLLSQAESERAFALTGVNGASTEPDDDEDGVSVVDGYVA